MLASLLSGAPKKDIVDTAVEAGSFKTLVAAVKAAGLVDTLKGEGPFTVFAPTDEAFAKLPKGTIASLLKPENKQKTRGYPYLPCRPRQGEGEEGSEARLRQNRQWFGNYDQAVRKNPDDQQVEGGQG